MPIVTIHVWDDELDAPTAAQLIGSVTDAVAGSLGEHVRPHTTVLVDGVPKARWGSAGRPASELAAAEGV